MSDWAVLENCSRTFASVLDVVTASAKVSEASDVEPLLIFPSPVMSCPNSDSLSSAAVL